MTQEELDLYFAEKIIIEEQSYSRGYEDAKKEFDRPHGKWEYTTHYARRFRVCSVCKVEKEDDRATGWNFCQYCGSDNRQKEGEKK